MQTQFDIHDAKTRLSQITEQVEAGGEAVIAHAGTPVVRLVRVDDVSKPRVLGRLAGRYTLPEDRKAPIPETPEDLIRTIEGR